MSAIERFGIDHKANLVQVSDTVSPETLGFGQQYSQSTIIKTDTPKYVDDEKQSCWDIIFVAQTETETVTSADIETKKGCFIWDF